MDDLTPTQDLMLELLAARHRTGEWLWTVERRHNRILRELEAKGLVGWKGGVVEGTSRAWLTDKAKAELFDSVYTPPVLDLVKRLAEDDGDDPATRGHPRGSMHDEWTEADAFQRYSEEARALLPRCGVTTS